MIVTVLGTGRGHDQVSPSSSFLVDSCTLLDCGSSVEILSVERMLQVRRVLLTQSHPDHCSALPLLLDCHARHGGAGITLYSQQETIDEIRAGLLRDWVDPVLEKNPDSAEPLLRCQAVEVGDALPLPDGMATPLPAQHTISSIGWLIEGPWRALAYSGDSGPCPAFWHWAANVPSLSDVICEVTYPDSLTEQAIEEGHMTAKLLRPMLDLMPPNVHLWISHLSHAHRQQVMAEITRQTPFTRNSADLEAATIIDL
jgi:ribonuclease BN (tRNA processing enzyme)